MSKTTKSNVTVNNVSTTPFSAETFKSDNLLAGLSKELGNEVVGYEMTLKSLDGNDDLVLTDRIAIEAISGIRESDKLEKYASYLKGFYLVKLVDSPFMRDNDLKTVTSLAKKYSLGVEVGTANSLENVARKLGVSFDDNMNLHFNDDTLPRLSFWHYAQVISLVVEDGKGGYNYDNLHEFLKLAHVSPLMSQTKLKEKFNDYRNGRLEGQTLELPTSVSEKAAKDAKRVADAEKVRENAENAKKVISAKVALDLATDFTDKQAVALSALTALKDCLKAINVDFDFNPIQSAIVTAEPPKATAKQNNDNAE